MAPSPKFQKLRIDPFKKTPTWCYVGNLPNVGERYHTSNKDESSNIRHLLRKQLRFPDSNHRQIIFNKIF